MRLNVRYLAVSIALAVLGIGLFAVSIFMYQQYEASGYGLDPRALPAFFGILCLLSAILVFWASFRELGLVSGISSILLGLGIFLLAVFLDMRIPFDIVFILLLLLGGLAQIAMFFDERKKRRNK